MNYDDIIHLQRPVSEKHKSMPMIDRAAQFAPFAALAGYDAAVRETSRVTDERIELDEYAKAALSDKLQILADNLEIQPDVTITYFQPDAKKPGGSYVSFTGQIKSIDEYERIVVMANAVKIPIEQIYKIESALFIELGYE